MKDFIYNIIAKPLFWLNSLTGDYALALLFFLILVRLVFIIFDFTKTDAKIKTKLSKPFVFKIKEKYLGKDSKKFENATMEVFEATKTSQFTNAIPVIIEYPIILAVFYSLYHPISILFPSFKSNLPEMTKVASSISPGLFEELNIINAIKSRPEAFSKFGDISGIKNINTKLFGKVDVIQAANTKSWSIILPILLLGFFLFLIIKKIMPVIQKKQKLSQAYFTIGIYLLIGISIAMSAFKFPILFYIYFIIFNTVGAVFGYFSQVVMCKKRKEWVLETNKKCQDILKKYDIDESVSSLNGENEQLNKKDETNISEEEGDGNCE